MSRYWRIYRTFFTTSLIREMEFRANFFAKVLGNAMWIIFFLMILVVIYNNTDSVAGWDRGDSMVLAATVFLMTAVSSGLFHSLQEIPTQVRMGTLDFVVTKPIDTQFWVSTRRFNFDQIGTIFAGLVMVAVGVYQAQIHPTVLQWLVFSASVGLSLAIFYAMNLAMMTSAIWLVRVENLWVLSESVSNVARFPTDIYPAMLQRVFTFYVPLALLATVPARQLIKGVDGWLFLVSCGWAVAALLFARFFWQFALRRYTSASS